MIHQETKMRAESARKYARKHILVEAKRRERIALDRGEVSLTDADYLAVGLYEHYGAMFTRYPYGRVPR